MGKWKCDICGKEFDNFQAQGFDNKIYCPLCYFKEKSKRLDKIIKKQTKFSGKLLLEITQLKTHNERLKSVLKEAREYIKEKELKDIKGNTLYCEENLIWHELALILAKVGDLDEC